MCVVSANLKSDNERLVFTAVVVENTEPRLPVNKYRPFAFEKKCRSSRLYVGFRVHVGSVLVALVGGPSPNIDCFGFVVD